MLGSVLIGGDERQIDVGLHRRGQLDLGLLRGLLQALQSKPVVAQIDALFLAEFVGEIIDDVLVEVFTAEEGVTVRRLHLEDPVADLEDRNIEGAAAEVIDRDRAGALLLHAVSERRCGRFVDDPQHLEPGNPASVLGRLALAVVEVGRHGDNRLCDRLAEISLGGFLHLLQNERADLGRGVFLAAALDPGIAIVAGDDLVGDKIHVLLHHRIGEAAADQALDRKKRVFGVGHRLAFGRLSNQALARVSKRDHRGRCPHALAVLDHLGIPAFHHGNAGVRRTEIDTDDLAHGYLISKAGPGGPGKHRPDPPGSDILPSPHCGWGLYMWRRKPLQRAGTTVRTASHPITCRQSWLARSASGRPWQPRPWRAATADHEAHSRAAAPRRSCR